MPIRDLLDASPTELRDLKIALDAHALVTITDAQGRILYANNRHCAVAQYARSELLGGPAELINPALYPEAILREMRSTIDRGQVWRGEIKNQARDGTFYWVDTTIVPLLDEQGRPRRHVAIGTDITARKRAQEALAVNSGNSARRRRQRAVLELVALAAAVAAFLAIAWATNWTDGLGRRLNVAGRLDEALFSVIFAALGLGGFAFRRWQDSEREVNERERVSAALRVLHDELDLRVRQRTEELADANTALRREIAERTRLAEIVQAMTEACYAVDAQWRLTFVNDRAVDLLRSPRAAMVGRPLWEVFPPLVGSLAEAHLRRAMRERAPVDYEWRSPVAQRWLNVRLFPVGDGLAAFLVDIQSRKEAEESLRLSEWKFAQAFANNPAAIALTRLQDGLMLEVNDTWVALVGFAREEVIGRPGRFIWSSAESAGRFLRILQEQGVVRGWEETFRKKSGELFVAQLSAQVLTMNHETVILSTLVDITARKRAEDSVRASERRLREMLETVELIAMTLDRHGRITFCNDYLLRLTGHSREEVLGRDWFEVYIPETDTASQRLFYDTLEAGQIPKLHQNAIRTRRGELREIVWYNTMLRDGAGQIVGTASIGEDVTERQRADTLLRLSEERFRQVVENIHEVFWLSDVDRREILYISPGYEKIWGRSRESLYASSLSWSESIHPDDRERVVQAASRQATAGYDEVFRVVRPDGSIRWVRARAFPVPHADGTVHRMVGVAEDVTERKSLEDQFRRAQRLEAVGTLAGGIAHDLNNILAPMLIVAPVLRQAVGTESDRKMVDLLEQAAVRGAAITRQLLTFSRGIEGDRGPVQVKHLVREMVSLIQETFPRDIAIASTVADPLWPVVADATQLHQVLMNLCVNARDAMPNGGRLSLSAQNAMVEETQVVAHAHARPGKHVLITVADNGQGIPSQVVDRIFEPFFTTKDVGKGTGLGLSTVLGIVKSHGGFVNVYSELGRGSTFKVYLPADPNAAESAPPGETAAPGGHQELILVVDDEESIRVTTQRVLESHGYRVLTAGNGREATSIFLEHSGEIRLVVTDLMMPEMNGVAFIRGLRAVVSTLPVIATSGLHHRDRDDELASLGVTEILAKPCRVSDLLQAVRRTLHPADPALERST